MLHRPEELGTMGKVGNLGQKPQGRDLGILAGAEAAAHFEHDLIAEHEHGLLAAAPRLAAIWGSGQGSAGKARRGNKGNFAAHGRPQDFVAPERRNDTQAEASASLCFVKQACGGAAAQAGGGMGERRALFPLRLGGKGCKVKLSFAVLQLNFENWQNEPAVGAAVPENGEILHRNPRGLLARLAEPNAGGEIARRNGALKGSKRQKLRAGFDHRKYAACGELNGNGAPKLAQIELDRLRRARDIGDAKNFLPFMFAQVNKHLAV